MSTSEEANQKVIKANYQTCLADNEKLASKISMNFIYVSLGKTNVTYYKPF